MSGTSVARTTFVALLGTGRLVHGFSLALLVAGAILASGGRGQRLVAASSLCALPGLYYAVRVGLDREVFSRLDRTTEDLDEGVATVRDAVPAGLGAKAGVSDPSDPLDPYRRSARLFFRQAGWTAAQAVLYVAALV